jgi:hypothetical protein
VNTKATDAIVAGAALCTFLWGLWVYRSQKKQDHELEVAKDVLSRFEKFQELQKRYREEDVLIKVRNWIYSKDHISNMPSDYEMQQFMEFFEEIALMINSRLMSFDLAAYPVGSDWVRFYEMVTTHHDNQLFRLFNSFALRMKERIGTLSEKGN